MISRLVCPRERLISTARTARSAPSLAGASNIATGSRTAQSRRWICFVMLRSGLLLQCAVKTVGRGGWDAVDIIHAPGAIGQRSHWSPLLQIGGPLQLPNPIGSAYQGKLYVAAGGSAGSQCRAIG